MAYRKYRAKILDSWDDVKFTQNTHKQHTNGAASKHNYTLMQQLMQTNLIFALSSHFLFTRYKFRFPWNWSITGATTNSFILSLHLFYFIYFSAFKHVLMRFFLSSVVVARRVQQKNDLKGNNLYAFTKWLA